MRPFVHPAVEAVTLSGILHALADPTRREILRRLGAQNGCPANCAAVTPTGLPKSTQSHHFAVLREAGLIRSERRGAEVVNTLRCEELAIRFPGVVPAILSAPD